MEEFNLHLTGDIHAITAANNLLAAQVFPLFNQSLWAYIGLVFWSLSVIKFYRNFFSYSTECFSGKRKVIFLNNKLLQWLNQCFVMSTLKQSLGVRNKNSNARFLSLKNFERKKCFAIVQINTKKCFTIFFRLTRECFTSERKNRTHFSGVSFPRKKEFESFPRSR